MIKSRIKNKGNISVGEIRDAYIKTFKFSWFERWLSSIGLGRLWIADETYKPMNLERFQLVFQRDKTNEEKYQMEQNGLLGHKDCDDFAYEAMGIVHQDRELGAMPIFNTWIEIPEGGHALLSFYKDNEVWFFEPQNDSIYRVPEGTKLIKMDG